MQYLSEQNIFLFLVQIFLLLALARGLGEIFRAFKQPPLTAEILVGVLIGPTILGRFGPSVYNYVFPPDPIQHNMLETMGWIGIMFFLLQTGLEIDLVSAWRQRVGAFKIAFYGVLIPFAVSFLCVFFFVPDSFIPNPGMRLAFTMFMATAMSLSAVTVSVRALGDLRLNKTDLGFLIISALSLNDIFGLLLFAIILAMFVQVNTTLAGIGIMIALTICFTVFCLTAGRLFAGWAIRRIKNINLPEPGTSLTFICILGLLCGMVTSRIGVNALLGFLIAGIMAGQSAALSERTRQIISQMVHAIFVPLFFAAIGLRFDFLSHFNPAMVLFVTVIGIGARFLGAWVGVRLTDISSANRLSIAIANIPGGGMEIIIGLIALQSRLISEQVFVAIICGAIISAVIVGPWLGYSIRKRKKISVLEFFLRDAIAANLKETDRDATIGRLCEIAAEQEHIAQADLLYKAVLARENAAGTAMEEGVAVPHARTELIKRPLVVFGRSLRGNEWNSPDGKPAQFIFLILTPKTDDEAQVQILGHIARAMSKPQTRQDILVADDAHAIWRILYRVLRLEQIKRR
jgi:Kef-type K+ transport system membrane component KefB